MRRSKGLTIWMIASSMSELWVHVLPQLCVFLFLFIVFHQRGLTLYECFWAGFPIGYCLVSWITFIVSGIIGYIDPFAVRIVYISFSTLGIILLATALRKIKNQPSYFTQILLEIRTEFALNVLILLGTSYFGGIFYTHMLYKDYNGNEWSGGSIWADFAFHLNIINSFLHGENKYFTVFSKLKSQIYSGSVMSYPFIPDFHAASLMSLGLYSKTFFFY